MIWVIGDIHGMFDPLKRILEEIRTMETKDDPVKRIIFIGDYIDHGPSVKEVIDYILKLEYDKVCLMGNHEDLALRFMNKDEIVLKRNGNIWSKNGYLDTYKSIYDHRDKADFLQSVRSIEDESIEYKGRELPKKYEKFLKGLKYFHHETFDINGQEVSFRFFHSLPNPKYPIKEQCFKNYMDFTKFLLKKSEEEDEEDKRFKSSDPERERVNRYCREMEYSCIWNRYYSSEIDFEGEVVIHGHTPTTDSILECFFDQGLRKESKKLFERYKRDLYMPFIFSRSPLVGYDDDYKFTRDDFNPKRISSDLIVSYDFFTDNFNGIEAINIDTGAVYGGALTALGLSERYLTRRIMPVLTVKTFGGQREKKFLYRMIGFRKLGNKNVKQLVSD
jgi:hypothetical protein